MVALFQYISPMLFPIFPSADGKLVLEIDVQHMVDKCSGVPDADAILTLGFEIFADGRSIKRETTQLELRKGKLDTPRMVRQFAADALGYLELSVFFDRPLLRKVYVGDDYVLWVRPRQGAISFGGEAKFALDRVIEQIRTHGRFCLVHSGAYVDRSRDIGNSLMFINPYDQAATARIVTERGRRQSARIDPKSVRVVDLAPILDDGQWDTVMVTANNRLPVYDLRHPTDNPCGTYSLDHLDTFSGYPTHRAVSPVAFFRDVVRRGLRRYGLRYL